MKKIIRLIGILIFILLITGCKKHMHTSSEWMIDRDATCSLQGKKHKECTVCKEVLEEETIEKLEHTWTDATCTKAKTCNVCGTIEDFPLGHNYDTSNIKWEWSDDNEEAEAVLICKNDKTHQERIQAIVTTKETTEAKVFTSTITYYNETYTDERKKPYSQGLEYILNEDGTSYAVKGIGNCTDSTIMIPFIYNQIPVTSIGDEAFAGCSSLTSIAIPDSVTSIGSDAFSSCSGLTSIIVNKNNPVYDSRGNCNAIIETSTNTLIAGCKNTIIPNNVTSIGSGAFQGCSSLTNITIPNSVTSIGWYAFAFCITLTHIAIPNSVSSLGYLTFCGCINLTSIKIGNGVTSIGGSTFSGCISLTSIMIPNSVRSIENWAFDGCSSLTSMMIPNSVISIGDWAFDGCSSLTSIMIPNSVISIGDWAFENCSSLTSIIIPNSVTSIGKMAFSGCSSLTSITFANKTGWFVATNFNAITGSPIDVTNSKTNVQNLTSTYEYYYWKRS